MATPQSHSIERVESPFARRDRAPTGARAEAPQHEPSAPARAEITAPPTGQAPAAVPPGADGLVESGEAKPDVRRLGVRMLQRLTGLRPMTGYEEQLIEDATFAENMAGLCNEVLARCLKRPGEDASEPRQRVAQLLVAERDAALVELRRMTYGNRLEGRVACPSCKGANEIAFDLRGLILEAVEAPEALEVVFSSGRVVRLRLPTAGDQAELLGANLSNLAERRTWLLSRCIERLGEAAGPISYEQVHRLDSRTRRELERELERATPGFDLTMQVRCQSCDSEFSSPLSFTSFFLPS